MDRQKPLEIICPHCKQKFQYQIEQSPSGPGPYGPCPPYGPGYGPGYGPCPPYGPGYGPRPPCGPGSKPGGPGPGPGPGFGPGFGIFGPPPRGERE